MAQETNKTLRKKPLIDLRYLGALALSVVLALAVGAVIMLLAGFDPLEAYAAMLRGVFGAPRHIGDALQYAMVLCLCGLACVIGSRVGIFNVGGLYALVPGVLKVKVKVNEVITTIMLNSIAAYLCSFLAKGPWKNANKNMVAATESLDARYWFGGLIRGSTLSTAIFAAAIIAFLVWYIMQKTARGFEMKLTGQNPRFARFAGLKTDRLIIACMTVSGMLCGLVGMFRVYGAEHIYRDSISRDYYFEGLMVAMIAQYRPLPVIGLSLLFAVLKIGADEMQAIGVPTQIYQIIQTVVIFFMAAETGISAMLRARAQKKRAHRAAEERMKGGVDRA